MVMTEPDPSEPDWAWKAKYYEHKPDWVDRIPEELHQLGEVFFPIPKGMKGWGYPHGSQEHRFSWSDEKLNAYLEQGWNYGISCDNSLIVVDIDREKYIPYFRDVLPDTLYQWSGSNSGVHLFYLCEGFNNRKTLRLNYSNHMLAEGIQNGAGKYHIGEVKADPNGYVVGPGSLHPSGNKYGPLRGESIREVKKERIMRELKPFIHNRGTSPTEETAIRKRSTKHETEHPFYDLTADDVLPWLEEGKRIAHPVHGSTSMKEQGVGNFMKNDDGGTFTCWRCQWGKGDGCGINAQQFLAMERLQSELGEHCCEEIRARWSEDSTLHYEAWMNGLDKGVVKLDDPPYTVLKGFLVNEGFVEEDEKLIHIHEAKEMLKYHVITLRR